MSEDAATMLIDDFTSHELISNIGTRWRAVSDRVMGGISEVTVTHDRIDGRACLRLSGDVRLENNGGFVQASLDLSADARPLDARAFTGVRLTVRGNGEEYAVNLRTPDNIRPWQSYRARFITVGGWKTLDLPFSAFEPHRIAAALDVSRLRRIGFIAIGRAFHADLAVASLALYHESPAGD